MPSSNKPVTIVGIGASAGGLEALERFFKNCPPDLDLAYVVVQHLSTQYKSMMDDLINRYTQMPVHMIRDGMEIKSNNIYLIPAGKLLTVTPDQFKLAEKSDTVFHLPIDIFFKSLAEQHGSRSIAVVLSGTGTDGSRGASEINAAGGFVIAQSPSDAKFDGMPSSLIATGIVDEVLLAEEIPSRIAEHIKHPVALLPADVSTDSDENVFDVQDDFDAILQLVKKEFGLDFSHYKWGTVSRRIERRMQVCRVPSLTEYLKRLKEDKNELVSLRRELLIPVTSFFRNEPVFDYLRDSVIPRIVSEADRAQGIRLWVAGCSTGEEAYSYGMLLLEEMVKRKIYIPVKIFATDANPEIIETASKGIFPESIVGEVPSTLLKRYFIENEGRYVVVPELRQCIVFATHNLMEDPPFTKVDLVSCRNTLIYFKKSAQDLALQKLQFALKMGGTLVLGKSESLTINHDKFDSLDSKLKIFLQKNPIYLRDFDSRTLKTRYSNIQRGEGMERAIDPKGNIIERALNILKQEFLPTSLLVDDELNALHLFGKPNEFLRFQEGIITNQVARLIDERLLPVVTTLFYRLKKEKQTLRAADIDAGSDNPNSVVQITGIPLEVIKDNYNYLIVFDIVDRVPPDTSEVPTEKELKTDYVENLLSHNRLLERELAATRENLQSTIEELETTNEELQATNEELMASNEELQSSNEELQSVNEELNTINAEYHERMYILSQVNADLDAMTQATSIASVFINDDMRITRYTPDSTNLFKLREHDVGRPLNEIVNDLDYPDLFQDLSTVIEKQEKLEKIVFSKKKVRYLARLVYYKLNTEVSGVVITFIDISSLDS